MAETTIEFEFKKEGTCKLKKNVMISAMCRVSAHYEHILSICCALDLFECTFLFL